jgi:hypothetical protein
MVRRGAAAVPDRAGYLLDDLQMQLLRDRLGLVGCRLN